MPTPSSETTAAEVPAARPNGRARSTLPYSKETYIAALSAVCIVASLTLRYALHAVPGTASIPLLITLVAGGIPLLLDLFRRLLALEFGSDLLAGLSVITAVLMGEYLVGAIVVLMLSGGAALEHYATRRASAVLDALAQRMPTIAHRKSESGMAEIALSEIAIGDTLVVLPHEICPVDGVVVAGHGSMDESYLTGEPFEMRKTPGSEVLSGAVNGEAAIVIRAHRLPVDSRYARIMEVMRASEQNRTPMRRMADRLGAWYTPLAVALAAAGWIWSGNAERFLAVMVIATPCPLLLAIPVATIGGISLSARRGIVIKNPAMLERIDACRTLIFDKTGTLTYGRPVLTDVVCAPGFSGGDVVAAAASLEIYSRHPLAAAIVDAARRAELSLVPVDVASEKPGEGLRGIVGGKKVQITGREKTQQPGGAWPAALPPQASGLECLVFIDGVYAACFRFHDEPRVESHSFLDHLKPRHTAKVILLSGDRPSEVEYFARKLGIPEMHAGKSPEEKVAIVQLEARHAKTLYIGDGLNDAPAMQAATVSVAFGKASDITAEAADAVVLEPSLEKVDELIHIGRHTRAVALESAIGGMALSAIGMLAAATGHLPPIAGAIAQELIDLAAVLNAVRVAIPKSRLTDF
ncbi:MAG TPA: heavy metal translocating P-type ATPase [Bryobacteraceae bacterium]|nr:heavy metal translocating P-type ATPase [Bryobacteraceae bacterium]